MADYRQLGARLSNWGRWGADDQRGTLNFITPARRAAALQSVRRGVAFDLSIAFGRRGPQTFGGVRVNPIHLMAALGDPDEYPGGVCIADDYIVMPLQAATQWDGLSHVYYDGLLYNGFPSGSITTAGAARNGIENLGGILARGVLLDIPRLLGLDRLDDGYTITPDDLEAAEARQGVRVGPGDIMLVRTGYLQVLESGGAEAYSGSEPGLGVDCCEWIHDREIAALASDNHGVEILPSEDPEFFLPLHAVLIRDLGMPLGEVWNLEELAADCEADGVWSFVLAAPTLPVSGGVGSPVSPVAVK